MPGTRWRNNVSKNGGIGTIGVPVPLLRDKAKPRAMLA